ncbi:MAG: polymerase subunit alpha [Pseudomonadota bacterium]|nr:polymerase subunit alpha [Pseudomonadota bacterium]
MENFVHLRLHTEYSVTDGILRVKDVVKLASSDQMLAVAITDLHNMFALVKFYSACREKGLKPIIGAELNVNAPQHNMQYKIIVLVKNNCGYRQLCELITNSYVNNKINGIPYVDENWLFDLHSENLIILSGGISGDIGQLLLQHKPAQALAKAKQWAAAYPNNYYLELQRINHPQTNYLIQEFISIAHTAVIPVVATHPIQFAAVNDFEAHEVRVCVSDSAQLDDEKRKSKFTSDQYFTTQAEMLERFADIPSSIINTVEIAKRCNFEITLDKYFLPDFATPDGNLNEYLSLEAHKGLELRLAELFCDAAVKADNQGVYLERLKIEIETIIQMGFAGYFLIVADFINWAKQNDVPVGPGRGSGAGSLVAFALGITDLDPLRYNLLFERFLNPERVSMPDFDIDFCQDKRELVIEYVKQKYGADAVSQIATFGTMSSKAVIKDVGRVLGLPYGLCDSISKLILNTPAKSYGLLEAYDKFPDLKDKIDNGGDDVTRLWELSLQLEDLTRSVGKHAAGVLIAPSKLTEFCPLYLADGMQTSQLDKDDVERVGLVKFDFLGLRNLTIIQETLANIKILHGIELKLSNHDFSDPKTYKLLQAGNTAAIFQLESRGMRRVLVKLEPDKFEEIIALLALYRPGPLGSGMVDDFVKRKKGEQQVDYFHDSLKACLEPTYGVIVYQEQVMQISQIVGGYTLGGADLLRRAMGKKKPEEMVKHKNIFVEGALKNGYTAKLAESLFDLMAMFAEYGFNKSHSAAYAVISYHTAYLKAHYLSSFMAATLSSELDNTDKLHEFYQDCLENQLKILPPDVNHSNYRFTSIDETTIRYALGALKGVGQQAALLIVEEREQQGLFGNFVDFCNRTYKKVNKRTIENLIKAGAFDALEPNRAKLLHNVNNVLSRIEEEKNNANQGVLFDFDACNSDDNLSVMLEDIPAFSLKECLAMEKQAMGYYFSGSLFDEYKDLISKLGIDPLSKYAQGSEDAEAMSNNSGSGNGYNNRGGYNQPREKILVCGVINYIGSRPLKKGGKIYFVNIEDDTSSMEFVLYDAEYQQYRALVREDEMVFVEGELMYDKFRNEVKITAKRILGLEDILKERVKSLTLHIDNNHNTPTSKYKLDYNGLAQIKAMCVGEDGATLTMHYTNANARCIIEIGEPYRCITPNYENFSIIAKLFDKRNWNIGCITP